MVKNEVHKGAENYIFATLLTGVYDVNRNELLRENTFEIIKKWYDSILRLKINAIIFHNTFSKETVEKYSNAYIQFIAVEYDERLKPNVFRYFVYRDYLKKNFKSINNIFVTDITDVEVIVNPFNSEFYVENCNCLFCGDEPEILNNEWMNNHCAHLRNLIPAFKNYETLNKNKILLNCGLIGANISVMEKLFNNMVWMHESYSYTNTTNYTLDMGVFNYVARTVFADKIIHGAPVNTTFKKYESLRTDCWFRHK